MRLAGFYAFAALILILPLVFPEDYYIVVVGVTAMVHVILAVSLNLFMGYAGQISLGHAAFFGLGAYTTAILTTRYGMDPWLAMTAGGVLVLLLSQVVARPILKLKGHYLAMATLGLGIIVNVFFVQADTLTGGPDGLSNIPQLGLAGFLIDTDTKWYYVIASIMMFVILASLNIDSSRAGRALKAIHGSEIASQMVGIDTASLKSNVFVLSAVISSITGSLFAHQQGFVSPDSFSFFFSVELVTMVVLGGLASTFGAVFGAVVLTYLPEFLSVFEDFEVMIFGAILMLIMIMLPKGIFVALCNLLRDLGRFKRARGKEAAGGPA